MTPDKIAAKKQAYSDEFDALEKQRQEIVTKQQQLQGAYQALESLETDAADPATTIEAKEDKTAKATK